MTRVRSWAASHKAMSATIVFVALVVMLAAAFGVAQATDRPAFCGSACHEMGPFHSAWSEGAHSGIECVDCHVEPGTVARVTHKAEAMKELWVHISGDPKFPLPDSAVVPNERCVQCHEAVATPNFDHSRHAKDRQCVDCHADAGHKVDATDLSEAGILNAGIVRVARASENSTAVVDGGSANIPGHVPVACSRCHDMAKTGCSNCHTPKHQETGPAEKTAYCQTCHAAGAQFVFKHPANDPNCAACHQPPTTEHDFTGECTDCHVQEGASWKFDHTGRANCENCHQAPVKHRPGACSKCHQPGPKFTFKHPGSKSECTACHTRPAQHRAGACATCHSTGVSWAFRHPSSRSCTSCHTRPSGHRSGSCTSCHRAGRSWAFRHPSTGSTCTNCHTRPSGHKSGTCSRCHRTGASWAFRHPSSSSKCTGCHSRPSGHRSGTCSTCHRTGKSWAFRHTSSSSCASCHKSPSGHYGNTCASCHSPSRSWSNAVINHPRVPGGEHTNRSFACKNCHPNGYGSANCSGCHDSASGPSDD